MNISETKLLENDSEFIVLGINSPLEYVYMFKTQNSCLTQLLVRPKACCSNFRINTFFFRCLNFSHFFAVSKVHIPSITWSYLPY